MKFNEQDYAKDILESCEKFYKDSNLPKIDLVELVLKVKDSHKIYSI